MNVRYRVELSQAERDELTAMLGGGKHAARKLKRAQILLAADGGGCDEEIARTVSVSLSTVGRTKRRFVEGNLERALSEEPRPGAERKLTGKEEALLVATACAKPPAGRKRWTLTLLADTMVKLTDHDSLSGETVRRRLAENDLKPWRRDMWCIPHVDGEYVARMEDVLDLYAETPDPAWPLVCFDETPVQLIGEARQPVPAQPGQRERYDYEYRRNGTVNLFVTFDPHRGWRNIKVTDRRAAVDYAHCMRDLVDVHYPDAACIRVVQDNLSIHKPGALYEAFAPAEARRILRRLEFHFTPKHASWLNMVECEISVQVVANDGALPLEAFLEGLRISWRGGEIRPTARPKPAAKRERRRPDPLLAVTAELEEWYQAEPWRTSREFLERVQAKYPGRYADGLIRTVQRRIKI